MFSPQPGTGCQNQDPHFSNPQMNDFNLLSISNCIQSGLDNQDMGARFFSEIPETPRYFNWAHTESDSLQIHLHWVNPDSTTHGNALDSVASIMIWRNDTLIAEMQNYANQDTLSYIDVVSRPDYYRYQIAVTDTLGNMGRKIYTNEMWLGGSISGIVIWELDRTPITGQAIANALEVINFEGYVYRSPYAARYPLESTLDAVFVCLGVYNQNHVLSDIEGQRLADYLDNGGNVYMEGGDTWFFDTQTSVHPYFEINPIADGGSDLFHVAGDTGTAYSHMFFDYIGENAWMDHIEPNANSFRIFINADLTSGIGVACDSTYKTIGTSFELGGLVDGMDPSAKSEVVRRILNFFGVEIISGTGTNENKDIVPDKFVVHQNYPNPFNNTTVFEVAVPEKGELKFQIFDISGQLILEKSMNQVSPTVHKIHWNGLSNNGKEIASGVYFYRFNFIGLNGKQNIQTRKLMLLR